MTVTLTDSAGRRMVCTLPEWEAYRLITYIQTHQEPVYWFLSRRERT